MKTKNLLSHLCEGGPSPAFQTKVVEVKQKIKPLTLSEKYDKYRKPLLSSKMEQYDVRSYEKDSEVQSITICLRK